MGNLFDIPAAFGAAPVLKTLEWEQNGQTHKADVYIRPLSWQAVYNHLGEDEQISHSEILARRIAESLCDKNGQALYTPEQIIQGKDGQMLCIELINALLNAISEVNSAGKS